MNDARLLGVHQADRAATTPARNGWSASSQSPEGEPSAPARVYLFGKDVILLAGVASQLRRSSRIQLVEEYRRDADGVAVVAADEVGDEMVNAIRAVRRSCTARVVVIATRLTRPEVDAGLAAGAWGFVRRADARPEQLAAVVAAVRSMDHPPATVEEALGSLDRADAILQVARPAGLSERDIEVLRLMADGHSTAAIAERLSYSESTIKNIIHSIVGRLGARNRAHAVAMAMRATLI